MSLFYVFFSLQLRVSLRLELSMMLYIDITQAFQQLKLKRFQLSLCFMQIKTQLLYKPGNIIRQLSA